MPRRKYVIAGLIFVAGLAARSAQADDAALWREYGLEQSQTSVHAGARGKQTVSTYRMKDLTGALAAWEWMRSASGKPCALATFCTLDGNRTVLADGNYVVLFEGAVPTQAEADAVLRSVPERRDSSLPAILTFLPRQGLTPDSARYVLGPVSLVEFAPELREAKVGLEQGGEAQIAEYRLNGKAVRLALFDYPTPEMARLYGRAMQGASGHVKRSDVLVAAVLGAVSESDADTLLSRVRYEAKITWNESPPPSPVKPLYLLLRNILYLSSVLSALCLAAGLFYAGMRVYRRRYGTLEADEAMTTLHLR